MIWRYGAIAWFNLTHKPGKLLRSLVGVIFAVVLMFMFSGFQQALFDSQLQFINTLNGDIFLLSSRRPSIGIPSLFPRDVLYRAQSLAEVKSIESLYFGEAFWKNRITHKVRIVRVIGCDLMSGVINIPEWQTYQAELQLPDTVLVDSQARPELGPITAGVTTELANRKVTIVGNFSLGNDFATLNGNVITSTENFLRYFGTQGATGGNRSLQDVDLAAIKVQGNPSLIAQKLQKILPKAISVYTKEQLSKWELNYWQTVSNIGFIFNTLTSMGFVIGIILCYQLLYADINENIKIYATLKAIGYQNFDLSFSILQQSILLAFFGFFPALVVSQMLYHFAAGATGLVFQMTLPRSLTMLMLTIGMCGFSGLISLVKVQSAHPADIF